MNTPCKKTKHTSTLRTILILMFVFLNAAFIFSATVDARYLPFLTILLTDESAPVDKDRDGYSNAEDCNDNNASINPGALENCTDGIDNDCDGLIDCADSNCSADPACPADVYNSLGMGFNLIPAGTFTMGSPVNELGRNADESEHSVTLTQSYYMQTTEITQGQWLAVMGSNPSYFPECGAGCPVEWVSWDEVQDFIAVLNGLGEGTYRLPTEAEWEYAARAGTDTAFANGDITVIGCGADPNLSIIGWFCYNSEVSYTGCYDLTGSGGSSCAGPLAVGLKNANAWNLYDMHGNAWEWCQDWYDVYPAGPVDNPEGPLTGTKKVTRGGSWSDPSDACRSANRSADEPANAKINVGFRLVKDLAE